MILDANQPVCILPPQNPTWSKFNYLTKQFDSHLKPILLPNLIPLQHTCTCYDDYKGHDYLDLLDMSWVRWWFPRVNMGARLGGGACHPRVSRQLLEECWCWGVSFWVGMAFHHFPYFQSPPPGIEKTAEYLYLGNVLNTWKMILTKNYFNSK